MAEKTEDLKLPMAVITRLIKDALPEGVIVSKEAKTAIARAASVFVLHTTSFANQAALEAKRKTLTSADVLTGVQELECDALLAPVRDAVDAWRHAQTTKRHTARTTAVAGAGGPVPATTAEGGDVTEGGDVKATEAEDSERAPPPPRLEAMQEAD